VRAAIPATATNANATAAVSSAMTAAGLQSSSYTVTLTPSDVSTATAGSNVTVQISATWANVGTHALGPTFGGINNSKTITATAVMAKESN
jgi:hypothetical protein